MWGCPTRPGRSTQATRLTYRTTSFEGAVSLATRLFDNLSHDGKRVRVLVRIKPGGRGAPSLEERKARDAAARLLLVMSLDSTSGNACRPLLWKFSIDLAWLIRPGDVNDPFELALSRRPRRRASSGQLREDIAHWLASRVYEHGRVDAAVNEATHRYPVSEKTVQNIWKRDAEHKVKNGSRTSTCN
jgi:hypothetical protein